jgi:predicted MPP superfamily phosphohydrolase
MAGWLGRTWARLSYGRLVEPTWLELTEVRLPVADLPAAFDGLRVAHLSDLHCGAHLPPGFLDEAVDLALSRQPDLIALTGDFIHKGYRHVEAAARLVGRMRAPLGVFAVLGNHDFAVRNALGWRSRPGLHSAMADALAGQGIRVLRNESVTLEQGGRLHLAGVDDLWSRACEPAQALAGLPAAEPRVLLAHNPRTVEHLGDHRCDVVLSGHTHGGQIDWPGLGRVTLGRKAKRYAAGLYRHGGTHLYVSRGVGFGFRFRFGVRPEVGLVTLARA